MAAVLESLVGEEVEVQRLIQWLSASSDEVIIDFFSLTVNRKNQQF